MQEDMEYDSITIKEPKRARWYTRLWPSCLGRGSFCCKKRKRQEFPLFFIGYDPVGQFQRAASVGDLASVERFINCQEYHINDCDRRRRTPLHYACAHNHPEVVRMLLSHSAYINVQDDEGCTPLIKATQWGNVECVSVLLMQGADPHLKDLCGNTALHHAISRGNTTIARKLLDSNADIDAQTAFGLTPYKLALFEGNQQLAQFLIQNGANTHLVVKPNSEGTSPGEAERSTKKHVTFNNELHFSTDSMPLSSGGRPSHPIKPILKKSVRISTDSVRRVQPRMGLRPSKEPGAPVYLTEDEVEEKAGVSLLKPSGHDTTVVPTSVHLEPTSVYDGDRRDIVQASHKNDSDSSQDTVLDPTKTLGDASEPTQDTNKMIDSVNTSDHTSYTMNTYSKSIPSLAANMTWLLVAYCMWVLTFLVSIMTRVIHQINQVFCEENYTGAPSNKRDEQVAAEADP